MAFLLNSMNNRVGNILNLGHLVFGLMAITLVIDRYIKSSTKRDHIHNTETLKYHSSIENYKHGEFQMLRLCQIKI
jgi:hypothetical protein